MTFAQQLWAQHRDLADACLLHPFVQGLGDGSLSQARYRYYIAQDAFYLEAFARAYTLAGAKLPIGKASANCTHWPAACSTNAPSTPALPPSWA